VFFVLWLWSELCRFCKDFNFLGKKITIKYLYLLTMRDIIKLSFLN
jgi:hypothetical protein